MLPAPRMAERIKWVTDVFGLVVRGDSLSKHFLDTCTSPAVRTQQQAQLARSLCWGWGAVLMVRTDLKCQGSVQSETESMSEREYKPPCGAGRHDVLEGDISRIVSGPCTVA